MHLDTIDRIADAAENGESPPVLLKSLLDDVQQRMEDEMKRRLAAAGEKPLRPAQACVLRFLGDEEVRMGELAARSGMSKQAFGQHVRQLERRGFVERVPAADDGRAKILRLTRAGRKHQRLARDAIRAVETAWESAVGSRRIAQLRAVLAELQATQPPTAR